MREIAYKGRDNTIELQLLEDGAAVDLASSVTRMVLKLDGPVSASVDSDNAAGVFDWSAGNGKLTISLGGQSLTAGEYSAGLVIYDPSNTNGLVWDVFDLTVEDTW